MEVLDDTSDIEQIKRTALLCLHNINFDPLTKMFDTSFIPAENFNQLPKGSSKHDRRIQLDYFRRTLKACTNRENLISYFDEVIKITHPLIRTLSYKLLPALFDSLIPIIRIMTSEEATQREVVAKDLCSNTPRYSYLHSLKISLWIIKQNILQPVEYHVLDSDQKNRDVSILKGYVTHIHKKTILKEIDYHVENPILVEALEHLIDDIDATDDPRSIHLSKMIDIYQQCHKENISDKHRSILSLYVAEYRETLASRGDAIELKPILALN